DFAVSGVLVLESEAEECSSGGVFQVGGVSILERRDEKCSQTVQNCLRIQSYNSLLSIWGCHLLDLSILQADCASKRHFANGACIQWEGSQITNPSKRPIQLSIKRLLMAELKD